MSESDNGSKPEAAPHATDPLAAKLELAGFSRRDFMKLCSGLVAALGLPAGCSSSDSRPADAGVDSADGAIDAADAADALTDAAAPNGKAAVLWLNAQDCNGCSISLLNLEEDAKRQTPSIASLVLDTISLRYHEPVMAGTGEVAETTKAATIAAGGYVLIIEGSIPEQQDSYCTIGGVPVRETVLEAAKNAGFIIALGSCAVSGGVVKNTVSQGRPVTDFVKDKPVINLPMCPANGEHLLLTIVQLLTKKEPPELDDQNRPKLFFSDTVHTNCSRLKSFADGKFLTDWNDPAQRSYCLLNRGCKGPATHSDCTVRGFNGGVSNCTAIGAPCQGCAEPEYYDGKPLYESNL